MFGVPDLASAATKFTLCVFKHIYIYIYKMKHALSPSKYGPFFLSYMSKIFHTFSRSWRWCSNSVKMEDLKQLLLMVSRLLDQNLRRTRIRRFLGEIQADLCRFVTGKRVCTPMVTIYIYIYSILKKIVQIQWIMYIYIYIYIAILF